MDHAEIAPVRLRDTGRSGEMSVEIVLFSPTEITDADFEAFVVHHLGSEFVPGAPVRGYVGRGKAVVWLVIDADELRMSVQVDGEMMLRELGCMPQTVLSFSRLRGDESVNLLKACAGASLSRWPLAIIRVRGTTVRADTLADALGMNIW